jgi:hypothetical protein
MNLLADELIRMEITIVPESSRFGIHTFNIGVNIEYFIKDLF